MMKNLLNCRTLIKVAVIMVVMAFMASWVTETYAKGKQGSYCDDAWDKQLGEDRFVLVMPTVANPDGEAVLDRETCLVWEQSPDTSTRTWLSALAHCFAKKVGDRGGWHLPTIEELHSLVVDDTLIANPALPSGHPFDTNAVQVSKYWSSTTSSGLITNAWNVNFDSGAVGNGVAKTSSLPAWCVRGETGHDGQ